MTRDDTKSRCVVCGKAISAKHKVVRISEGYLRSDSWEEESVFGNAHSRCFALSVESPNLILKELRRATDEPSTKTALR